MKVKVIDSYALKKGTICNVVKQDYEDLSIEVKIRKKDFKDLIASTNNKWKGRKTWILVKGQYEFIKEV